MALGSNSIEIKPVSPSLGAEILGVDLRDGLDDETFAAIKQAYSDHGVIFFRDQQLRPEDHIAFAERWNKINVNRFFHPVDGYPMIAEVRKEPEDKKNIGSNWHTDHSYDQIPAMGSVLYALETPPVGGDTIFSSMYLAYETLSDGLKSMLEGLSANHSSRHVFGASRADEATKTGRIGNAEQATQDAVHPVVITHPLSGRKALYVNPEFTLGFVGWSPEESKPLLDYLYAHASRPEFTCRFRWADGSVAFWDNRATWHCALNDYHGHRRLMHRITVEGVSLN